MFGPTMMRLDVALLAGAVFLAVSVAVVVMRARRSSKLAVLTAAGLLCFGLFVVVNVVDWPGALLGSFWAQHAIVAATVSTVPLAGVGFFAFKHYDTSVQADLDEKIAATGRSGVVDHLVDVDVALALLSSTDAEIKTWRPEKVEDGRPLRWLRDQRHRVGRVQLQTDPRLRSDTTKISWGAMQDHLVDEAVRRLMAGIRDWGPMLARSRQGERDLIELGDLRLKLLDLGRCDACTSGPLDILQQRCRELAWRFETSSNPRRPRPELLDPLTFGTHEGEWGRPHRQRARRRSARGVVRPRPLPADVTRIAEPAP